MLRRLEYYKLPGGGIDDRREQYKWSKEGVYGGSWSKCRSDKELVKL